MSLAALALAACFAAAQSPTPTAPAGFVGAAEPEVKKTTDSTTQVQSSPPPIVNLSDKPLEDDLEAKPKKKKKKRNPDDEPFVIPSNPLRVKVHKEAAQWQPVSVKVGGSAQAAKNSGVWKQQKKGKKVSGGVSSKAKSVARLYPSGEDKKLVVAVFPDKLAAQRTHIEVRFQVIEGHLEKVAVVAVTADPGGEPLDDAAMLRLRGVGFQEERPASASVLISGIDAKPGKRAFNGGALKLAAFSESQLSPKSLGLTTVEWMAKGLTEPKKP